VKPSDHDLGRAEIHRIADCDVAVTVPRASSADAPSPWMVFLHGRGHTSFETHNFFTSEFAVFRRRWRRGRHYCGLSGLRRGVQDERRG